MTSSIGRLDRGLSGISRWQVHDETHLPKTRRLAPSFAPAERPLHDILNPPSLDDRLAGLLRPEVLNSDLLEPAVLSQTREDVARAFRAGAATGVAGHGGGAPDAAAEPALAAAARVLEEDVALDAEIRSALAALLRG